MTWLGWRASRSGRLRAAVAIGIAGLLSIIASAMLLALPLVERFKVDATLADAVRARVSEAVPVAVFDFDEPGLLLYLGRDRYEEVARDDDAIAWARRAGPGVIVMTRARRERIEAARGSLGLVEVAAVRGYNYSKGEWVDVQALARPSP
jgi:hypothetical protein